VETPANPTLDVTDLKLAAELAHAAGALLVVDNTFLSPYLQNPIAHGADVALHSMTKSMNGHADVVAGIVTAREPELFARLAWSVRNLGGTIDPHQAWLVHRGLRTLPLRMECAQSNATRVAEYLEGHEKVERVWYPGLPSHPGHRLLGGQMAGPGCVLAFEVTGGVEGGRRLLDHTEVMTLAVSLGGIETLIQHPASMTHAGVSREDRLVAGISDGLVRLSVGCEDADDILADLEQALARV
jgi:methionine-gamma-lyase